MTKRSRATGGSPTPPLYSLQGAVSPKSCYPCTSHDTRRHTMWIACLREHTSPPKPLSEGYLASQWRYREELGYMSIRVPA